MSNNFNLYPTISPLMKTKLGIHHNGISLLYSKDYEVFELKTEAVDSTGHVYTITDPRNFWDPENYDISIKREYTVSNPSFLFGPNGVCPVHGSVGLAVLWSCKGTNSRGAVRIGNITAQTLTQKTYTFEKKFLKGSLRNHLELELIVYLKDRGKSISTKEIYLANTIGVILGSIDHTRIIIDGNASIFPIVTVDEPSQPLWWVDLSYTDPLEESFTADYISIRINRKHSDYSKLESDSGITANALLLEIMASAVQIIVNDLKKTTYWAHIEHGNNISPGSIAEAILYILDTYELKGLSEEQFARTLRLKLGVR